MFSSFNKIISHILFLGIVVVVVVTIFISSSSSSSSSSLLSSFFVSATALNDYVADAVDNRPRGRYRYGQLLCFSYRDRYFKAHQDAVAIIGGTTPVSTLSSDFHMWLPGETRWVEFSENKLTFDARHSHVVQPIREPAGTDDEFVSYGGVKIDKATGIAQVTDELLIRSMHPIDPLSTDVIRDWRAPLFQTTDVPQPRARASSFALGDKVFIYSGITNGGVILGDLWELKTTGAVYSWREVYIPQVGDGSDTANLAPSFYTFGGSSTDAYGGAAYSSYTGFSYGSSAFAASSSYTTSSSSSSSYAAERDADVLGEKQQHKQHKHKQQHQQYDDEYYYQFENEQEDEENNIMFSELLEMEHNNNNKQDAIDSGNHHAHHHQATNVWDNDFLAHHQRHYEMLRQNKKKKNKFENHDQKNNNNKNKTAKNKNHNLQQQQQQQEEEEQFSREAKTTSVADSDLRRYGACCAAVSSTEAVCFGGTGASGDFRSVLKFDETLNVWSKLAITNANSGPKPVRDAACAYNAGQSRFVVFGGFDSRSGAPTRDDKIYFLDVTTATWTAGAAQAGVTPVFGASMCTTPGSGKTYFFGGRTPFLRGNGTLIEIDFTGGLSSTKMVATNGTSEMAQLPAARWQHVAVASGSSFFLGFGRKKTAASAINDWWQYDLLDSNGGSWVRKRLSNSISPRWGPAAATIGPNIYIFGGAITDTHATNELLLYETQQEYMSIVTINGAATLARQYHVCFRSSLSLVCGLGSGEGGSLIADTAKMWASFSPVDQSWSYLTLEGDTISPRIGASVVERYNESHALVGLGFDGAATKQDWFFVEVSQQTLRSTKLNVDRDVAVLPDRVTRRSFASVAGRGRHILVCGGLVGDILAAPPSEKRCYQIDVIAGTDGASQPHIAHFDATLNVTSNVTTPIGLVGAPAVYLRDSIFVAFGAVISDPVIADVFYSRLLRIRPSPVCGAPASPGQLPDDTACSLCGFGSSGVGCDFTPPGQYQTATGATISCPIGTFNALRGGADSSICIPCRVGEYGDAVGLTACKSCNSSSFCPIGSSTAETPVTSARAALLTEALPADGVLRESNPEEYESPGFPFFPAFIVGGMSVALAVATAIILYINHLFDLEYLNYYFPEDTRQVIERIFKENAFNGRQMSTAKLCEVFSDLGMNVSSSVLEKSFFDQVEDSGNTYLLLEDFERVFIDLIKIGILPPFAGSRAEAEGLHMEDFVCSELTDISLVHFDAFKAKHNPVKLGEPSRVKATQHGGILSIIMFVAVIILFLAVLLTFLYSNVVETKSIVPYSVMQAEFGDAVGEAQSDFSVAVGVVGPIRDSPHFDKSDTAATRARKTCIDPTTLQCSNESKVVHSGFTFSSTSSSHSCYFNETTLLCTITWRCFGCTVISASQLSFSFNALQSATRIYLTAITTTGIHPPHLEWTGRFRVADPDQVLVSEIIEAVSPRSNASLFSGLPASKFDLGLSKTYFASPTAPISASDKMHATGYHLRPNAAPTKGNSIAPEFFGAFYDTPVHVSFTTDTEIMLVRRTFVQSAVELISSLLGSISGLMGAFLAATNFIDEMQEQEPDPEEDEDLENNTESSSSDDDSSSDSNSENNQNDKNEDENEDENLQQAASIDFDMCFSAQKSISVANESDVQRVLKIVSFGIPVDLALNYVKLIRHRGRIPNRGENFILEDVQRRTAGHTLDFKGLFDGGEENETAVSTEDFDDISMGEVEQEEEKERERRQKKLKAEEEEEEEKRKRNNNNNNNNNTNNNNSSFITSPKGKRSAVRTRDPNQVFRAAGEDHSASGGVSAASFAGGGAVASSTSFAPRGAASGSSLDLAGVAAAAVADAAANNDQQKNQQRSKSNSPELPFSPSDSGAVAGAVAGGGASGSDIYSLNYENLAADGGGSGGGAGEDEDDDVPDAIAIS